MQNVNPFQYLVATVGVVGTGASHGAVGWASQSTEQLAGCGAAPDTAPHSGRPPHVDLLHWQASIAHTSRPPHVHHWNWQDSTAASGRPPHVDLMNRQASTANPCTSAGDTHQFTWHTMLSPVTCAHNMHGVRSHGWPTACPSCIPAGRTSLPDAPPYVPAPTLLDHTARRGAACAGGLPAPCP